MTNPDVSTTAAIARAFTEAWTSGDMGTAARYVADDIVFDGPLGHTNGKPAYLQGLTCIGEAVALRGVRVLAAYGDDTQALIMYDLLSDRFGPMTCAKLFTFHDGKIARDRLTFDSHSIRTNQSS